MSAVLADQAYRSLGAPLRGYLRRRVDDDATADDLLQTVLLRVLEQGERLRDEERLAPWVYGIARNAVTDHHRSQRRRRSLDDADLDAAGVDEMAQRDAEGRDRDLHGLSLWLAWQIDALEPAYAEALRLTELEGLTMAQAGERLGLSPSGVKSRVQRGRAQLKGRLLRCCSVELDHGGRPVDFAKRAGVDRRDDGCADCGG